MDKPNGEEEPDLQAQVDALKGFLASLVAQLDKQGIKIEVAERPGERPAFKVIRGGLAAFTGLLALALWFLRHSLRAHPVAFAASVAGVAAFAILLNVALAPSTTVPPPSAGGVPFVPPVAVASPNPSAPAQPPIRRRRRVVTRVSHSVPVPGGSSKVPSSSPATTSPSPSPAHTQPSPSPSATHTATPSPSPSPSDTDHKICLLGIICLDKDRHHHKAAKATCARAASEGTDLGTHVLLSQLLARHQGAWEPGVVLTAATLLRSEHRPRTGTRSGAGRPRCHGASRCRCGG